MHKGYYEKTGFVVVKVQLHKGIGYKLVVTKAVIANSKDTVTVSIDTGTRACEWWCVPKSSYFEDYYEALEIMQTYTEGDNN